MYVGGVRWLWWWLWWWWWGMGGASAAFQNTLHVYSCFRFPHYYCNSAENRFITNIGFVLARQCQDYQLSQKLQYFFSLSLQGLWKQPGPVDWSVPIYPGLPRKVKKLQRISSFPIFPSPASSELLFPHWPPPDHFPDNICCCCFSATFYSLNISSNLSNHQQRTSF